MDLSPGESVIYEGRPSWRSIISFYLTGVLVAAAAGVIAKFVADSTGGGVGIGAAVFVLWLIAGFFKRFFTKYTITTRRLRVKRGVLTKRIQETRIDRLQDHSIRQTLFDRIFRVGTIDFDTSGEEHAEMFRFVGVDNPEAIILDIDRVARQTEAGALPPDPARG